FTWAAEIAAMFCYSKIENEKNRKNSKKKGSSCASSLSHVGVFCGASNPLTVFSVRSTPL
ncbi:hypothetical protein, partial [Sutterella wadsworthensis]|uniref:hypothetical protein n=1 Tax=Sutterella wadsworthensis TaxID=40545 RepID=UPI003AEFA9C0